MTIFQLIDYKSIAQLAVSLEGVCLFCFSIILVTITVYLFGFRRKASALIRNLKRAIKSLKQASGPDSFATKFTKLDEDFCNNQDIGHCWREFKETLVMPSVTAADPVICNTEESVCFFNENTVITNRINLKFYMNFPNYLTGTGILGTFLGLVAGIYLASQGLASEDTAELHKSLQNLLSGASLAFWTSICGLFCSIMFSWREKVKTHELGLLLGEWNKEMDSRIERITPESLAQQQLNQLEKQSEYLEEFTTKVAFNIADALNDRLNEKIVPVMEKMIESVDLMRRDRGESNEEMLKQIVNKFSKTMDDAAGKELNALSKTLMTLNETLVPLLDQMNEAHQNMQRAALYISEQIKDSYKKSSQEFSEGIQAAIDELKDSISNAGTTLNGGLKDAFDHAVEKLQGTIEKLDTSINNISEAGRNTEQMAEVTRGLLESFDNVAISMSEVQSKVHSSLTTLEQIAVNIKKGGDVTSEMASQARKSLSEFSQVVAGFQSSQQTIESSWKNYSDRFENVDSSLEGVFKQIEDGLNAYAEATSKYMADLDRHSAKIVGLLGGAVTDLGDHFQDFSDALTAQRQ
jgi:methyl-accepting chemotaxis protein